MNEATAFELTYRGKTMKAYKAIVTELISVGEGYSFLPETFVSVWTIKTESGKRRVRVKGWAVNQIAKQKKSVERNFDQDFCKTRLKYCEGQK